MVERWIQRERVKDKAELRKFSEVIARDMYDNQQTRGGLFIPHGQLDRFAKKHGFRLEELEMRSRSLLNRNAEGKYKFAHKSILEYLLSLEIIRDRDFRAGFNYDNMEQTRRFYAEQFFPKFIVPFFSRPLKGFFFLFDKDSGRRTVETKKIDIKKLDLKELENIAKLDLRENQITDLTPLQELNNIQYLNLNSNQITDLTPLKELKTLQRLGLSNNIITNLKPLQELKNIQYLDLSFNQITDLTPLLEMTNLKYLYLTNNPIKENAAFEELERRMGDNLEI